MVVKIMIFGYIGVMWEYLGNIGIMEKKMGTTIRDYMRGCQNYGPFLDPYNNTAPHI